MVYIIVLNYNGWKDTLECLESLLKIDYQDFKIIVVDNCSTDNSVLKINEWAQGIEKASYSTLPSIQTLVLPYTSKPLRLESIHPTQTPPKSISFLLTENNKGYAFGNNVGIRHALLDADCDYVWILNNDTIVTPFSLKELVDQAVSSFKTGLVGSKLLFYQKPEVIQAMGGVINPYTGICRHVGEGLNIHHDKSTIPMHFDYIVGASMLVKRKFIEDVGLLCEDYFLYNEESDWCKRGLQKSWNYELCSKSIVYHKHGASTGTQNTKSEKIDLIELKSRLIFMQKFYPQNMLFVYISFLIVIINRLKRGQFQRIPKIIELLSKNMTGSSLKHVLN